MRKLLLIAAFMVFLHPGLKAQAEGIDHTLKLDRQEKIKDHKNADKILAFLRVSGLHHSALRDVAYFMDERIEDGNFVFAEGKHQGIHMQFRYNMEGFHRENIELNFRPEGEDYEFNINPEQVMFRYQVQF